MKCLPANRLAGASGQMLHDSHAEILALRCLNHFLIQECKCVIADDNFDSPYISCTSQFAGSRAWRPFGIKKGVKFHMYSSTAPCGDASMELVMRNQEDPTPWPLIPLKDCQDSIQDSLKGRGSFSELGIVRRKPARADSPLSFSKSCSDKLAMKQCASLLNSTTSVAISPENAYLSSLIVPESEYIQEAYTRSFSPQGRMGSIDHTKLSDGYCFQPFESLTTKLEFKYSRRQLANMTSELKGSNICALWNPYVHETLINGVLQGWKLEDPRCASSVSRKKLTQEMCVAVNVVNLGPCRAGLDSKTYRDFKDSELLRSRRQAKDICKKEALRGWVANVEDSFSLPPYRHPCNRV